MIKCPHCGTEYAPAEIFLPNDLTGTPAQVVRDACGKVIFIDYPEEDTPVTTTQYICDNCGKAFRVEPVISYKVKKEAEEFDFSETSTSLLD